MEDEKVASGELEKSLRDEVDKYVNSRLSQLQDELAEVQNQLNEAFARLRERSASEATDNMYVAAAISEHIRAAHERGIEEAAAESSRTKTASDTALIKAAVDDLDDQRTQADILNTLVNRASSFAPRVAFFVLKNERAIGWRARGFEGTIGDDAVREINLSLAEQTPLSEVVHLRATWSGAPGQYEGEHNFLGQLGAEPPQHMVAVPLIVRDRCVAVLYADSAGLDSESINLEALETLVRVGSMAVELIAIGRPAPAQKRPARIEQPAAAAQQEEQQPEQAHAEEVQPAYQESAVESQPASSYQPQEQPQEEQQQYAYEAPPQEMSAPQEQAAPEEEEKGVAPFVEPSHSLMDEEATLVREGEPLPQPSSGDQFSAPLGGARQYGGGDADLPVEVGDEERRLHNDARRFARLLVSEIKLYNEQKVREGRSQGDIYERLREDIDRSRQMYDKRVAPPVAARYDYFHQELVNTLAEGDSSKLGHSYPGSTVSA